MRHMRLSKVLPEGHTHTEVQDAKILELCNELKDTFTSWHEDGSSPPNYLRRDGLGNIVAEVNVWCGGFQNPHKPKTIGWRAQLSNHLNDDVILVGKRDPKMAIKDAMQKADRLLQELWDDGNRNEGGWNG